MAVVVDQLLYWGRAEQESCIGWLVLTVYGGAVFGHAWCTSRKEKKPRLHEAKLLSSRFSASNKLEPRGTFLCLCKKLYHIVDYSIDSTLFVNVVLVETA